MTPIIKKRELQKAETHRTILEIARDLFETDGFERTTMRTVAFKAEIGLGTIYKHFTNKKELLATALLEDIRHLFDTAMAAIPENVSFKQQFIFLSRHFYSYYASRPKLIRVYLTNFFPLDARQIAPIDNFDNIYAEMITALAGEAYKRGEIRQEKDYALVARSLIADYFYVLVNYFLRYNVTDTDKLIEILEGLVDQTIP